MANASANEKGAKSMQDIAAMLVESTQINEEVDELDEADEVEQDEEVPTGEDSDDTDAEVAEEPDEPEAETSENEGDEEEGDDQPDDESDDEPEYLDIHDDDVITVMVDGQEQELTIGELKKAHSLGGATEKRLQEATELRKTAHAERTQMLEKLADQERLLTQALTDLDDSVFTPVISAPPQELRRSNPDQYLRHQEAYQEDQKRIANAKKSIEGKLEALNKQRTERLQTYAQEAGKLIIQEIPELANEQAAPKMLERLTETAKSYGYTDQEIQMALDPRMFMLVRDAMRYRDMAAKNREKPDVTRLEGQNTRKVRRLRSGSTSTAKARARQKDKDRQKVVDNARKTGKVNDVAATLLTPRG